MDEDQIAIPSFTEIYHSNPAGVIFTIVFALIVVGTLYFYLTVRQRQRMPVRRRPFQSVRDAIEFSKRVKQFMDLVKKHQGPAPVREYKPLVGGLPPRRDETIPARPAEAKDEPAKP